MSNAVVIVVVGRLAFGRRGAAHDEVWTIAHLDVLCAWS